MAEVLHANIFFFITGIGVIVLTMLLSVVLYHLIKILASIRRIVERVESGTETLIEDIEEFRSYIMEESIVARFINAMLNRSRAKRGSNEEGDVRMPKKDKTERKSKTELKVRNEE